MAHWILDKNIMASAAMCRAVCKMSRYLLFIFITRALMVFIFSGPEFVTFARVYEIISVSAVTHTSPFLAGWNLPSASPFSTRSDGLGEERFLFKIKIWDGEDHVRRFMPNSVYEKRINVHSFIIDNIMYFYILL